MTDEQRKSVAPEYFRRLDTGGDFFELFAEDSRVYFPKWGVASGRAEIEKLFGEMDFTLSSTQHHYEYFACSGTTRLWWRGRATARLDGVEWRGGVTHAGCYCDVFEIRDSKIRRLFIYFDPYYAGAHTERYTWLEESLSGAESSVQ